MNRKEKEKAFGKGPWLDEPDEEFFEYKGYECHINRVIISKPNKKDYYGGHLCGYVKIPESHPWCNKHYDEIDPDVHGGLTFSKRLNDGYWIGFDCAHCMDIVPSVENIFPNRYSELKKRFSDSKIWQTTYRTFDYVKGEIKSLVEQLIEVKTEKEVDPPLTSSLTCCQYNEIKLEVKIYMKEKKEKNE